MSSENSHNAIPAKYRNAVIHDRSPSNYPGDYQVTDEALKNYNNVPRNRFGSTEVLNADGSTFIVKDYQYVLEDGSVGMTFLPVSDNAVEAGPDGENIFGSSLVDAFLRKKMNLKPTDTIYAPIYYIHPEENKGTLQQLGNWATSNKIQMGVTHWGAYLGHGRTSNSPALYHNRIWSVSDQPGFHCGYPANVMIMSLDGVDQATLNKNMLMVDNFLNYGVRFPADYKDSKFRTADLNTAFMFYRDWIYEKNYLKVDTSWFTFCAAHKTLVAIIGMNLPHNPAAFKEVYGDEEGQKFWDIFCQNHFTLLGLKMDESMQTDFEPLWKKHGLTPAQIRPFTLGEYYAYDAARRSGQLADYKGFMPLQPGQGMPWGPQMTADALYDFVQTYADFVDAGAIAMSATVFFCANFISNRTGASLLECITGAVVIAQHAMQAHARLYAAQNPTETFEESGYYKTTFATLYAALGGTDKNLDVNSTPDFEGLLTGLFDASKPPQENLKPALITWFSMLLVRQNWTTIMAGGEAPIATAYTEFMDAVQAEFEKARNLVVTNPGAVQYNVPPALAHMVGIKMFECSEFVSIKTVLTAMTHTELERVKSQ